MSRESVQALREALDAVDVVKWRVDEDGQRILAENRRQTVIVGSFGGSLANPYVMADGRLIAAANPVAIRSLLAQLDAAQRVVEALDWAMNGPHGHSYVKRSVVNEDWCDKVDEARAALSAWKEAQQ